MLAHPAPDTIIVDECHHAAASTWAAIIEAFLGARGLLASRPRRSGAMGRGLREWFDHFVVGPSVVELIAEGYLSHYRLFAPSQPNLDAVPIVRGDYAAAPADEIMRDPRIVGDAVATYLRLTRGKRALAFCTSIGGRNRCASRRASRSGDPSRALSYDEACARQALGRVYLIAHRCNSVGWRRLLACPVISREFHRLSGPGAARLWRRQRTVDPMSGAAPRA